MPVSCWIYQNEAAVRTWIDAFFFRVSAIVSLDETMVLSMGKQIPCTTDVNPSGSCTLRGLIAAVVDEAVAGEIVF